MKSAVINLKTNPELKQKAQQKAQELGLSLSAVINLQLREFVKGKDIHIQVDERDEEDKKSNEQPKPPIMLA